jgi:hypothetical protein
LSRQQRPPRRHAAKFHHICSAEHMRLARRKCQRSRM